MCCFLISTSKGSKKFQANLSSWGLNVLFKISEEQQSAFCKGSLLPGDSCLVKWDILLQDSIRKMWMDFFSNVPTATRGKQTKSYSV